MNEVRESRGHYRGRPDAPMRPPGARSPYVRHHYTADYERLAPRSNTLPEVAELLGHPVNTVWNWVVMGWLHAAWTKPTHLAARGRYLITRADLEAFLTDPRSFSLLKAEAITAGYLREMAMRARAESGWVVAKEAQALTGYTRAALSWMVKRGRVRRLCFRNARFGAYFLPDLLANAAGEIKVRAEVPDRPKPARPKLAWPAPHRLTLANAPILRCGRCKVATLTHTRLCPWCGAVLPGRMLWNPAA